MLGGSADELGLHLGGDLAALGPAVEAGQPNQRKALTSATRSCSQHRRTRLRTTEALARHHHTRYDKHAPTYLATIVPNHRIRI